MTVVAKKRENTPVETALIDGFADVLPGLPGGKRVTAMREAAIAAFARLGLPHRRVEAWRYTDLRVRLTTPFTPRAGDTGAVVLDDASAAVHGTFADVERAVAVIVDGRFRPELSTLNDLGEGVEILDFADAVADDAPEWVTNALGNVNAQDDDPAVALNTAYMAGGLAVCAKAGAKASRPLHLAFVNTLKADEAAHARNVIVIEEGAEFTLIETHVGADQGYLANVATDLVVGKDAKFNHIRVQTEGAGAVHLSSLLARIEASASYNQFTAAQGSSISRHQSFIAFAGEDADVQLSGATMLRGKQQNDTTLVVDHAVPACVSRELFKNVVDDEAHAIFQGKVMVAPHAQKSDGQQMSQGLLLSERAAFTSKPELEIFADDVLCAHGATSGELDEDLLFYLRTRGIPETEAKSLLIAAFLGEAIDTVENEAVRDALTALSTAWLSRTSEAA